MRKTIVIILALASHYMASAQQAETIESFIANSHEPEWYAAQAEAWQKIVDENPQDQWAWRNLFRATCYHDQFTGGWGENQDESKTADVGNAPGDSLARSTDTIRIFQPVHDTLYLTQVVEKERVVNRYIPMQEETKVVAEEPDSQQQECTSIQCDGINYAILASK